MEELSLEARKAEIGAATDAFVAQQHEEEEEEEEAEGTAGGDDAGSDSDSDSDSDSSGDEAEPEVKKAPEKKPVMTIKTKSGAEAPKQVAKLQANAMKSKHFESQAQPLTVEVLGNIATGEARSFSSGNKGWYLGGKIEVTVGKKKLWAQLGLNLTILGSKQWS